MSPEVVVLSPLGTIGAFSELGASRQLLWALRESGIRWSLWQPWRREDAPDMRRLRGVIVWSYRHRRVDFMHHAIEFERKCDAWRIPVINGATQGWDTRHSTTFRRWRAAGVACPRYQKFSQLEDIELPYPFILRVDGVHRGQAMRLVRDAQEAEAFMAARRRAFLSARRGRREWPPPNLAIEYIDVSNADGLHHKRRAYVVGDHVVYRRHMVSRSWLVNQSSSEQSPESRRAHTNYVRCGEQDLPGLIRAGRTSGSEVAAIDYSVKPGGGYIFWEANRHFRMAGDKNHNPPKIQFERREARRVRARRDRQLGDALLRHMRERLVRA